MDRLSPEQETLMTWLELRPSPVCLREIQEKNAPGYTYERVRSMSKDGLLSWKYGSYQGDLVAVYSVSDKGRAMLLELQDSRRKEAEYKRQQRFQNQVSVAQVLIPLVTFVLGLIVEHYAGLISGFSEVFGRWIK